MPANPATTHHGVFAPTARARTDVQKPAVKFLIGLFASLCAVLLPRLSLAVFATEGASFRFITPTYVLAAIGFSTFVGVAVMLKEWKIACPPWDTFMASLGIPALIAGTLNGHLDARQLGTQVETRNRLENALIEQADVLVSPSPAVTPVGRYDREFGAAGGTVFGLMLLPGDTVAGQLEARLGTQLVEPKYWVVVDRPADEAHAQASADQWRRRMNAPGATPVKLDVVPLGPEFLVVEGGGPRTRSDALLVAMRLKKDYGVRAELQEVPKPRS